MRLRSINSNVYVINRLINSEHRFSIFGISLSIYCNYICDITVDIIIIYYLFY